MRFILFFLITAVALIAAVWLVDGIHFTGSWPQLMGVAAVFGLINTLIKPFFKAVGCLMIVLTLGLFLLVINALMLWLTGAISSKLGLGFQVDGFVAAFLGGLVVSVVSTVLGWFLPEKKQTSEE